MQTQPNTNNPSFQEETQMECDKVWDLLSVYAAGEASPQEAAVVEAHVAVCPDCARDLRFMQSTHEVLESVPEVEPPASLRSAILAATVYRPSLPQRLAIGVRKTFGPAPVRYGALAAAGAAAALTAVMLHNNETPVHLTPTTPPVVATAPSAPSVPSITEEAPVLDLLDAYSPEKPRGAKTASAERARARRVAFSPVRNMHAGAASRPQPSVGARENRPANRASAPEPSHSDDIAPSTSEPSATAPAVQPDPEPVVRLVAGATENATSAGTGASAVSHAGASGARIVLTAAAVSLDPTQVASLADLRRSLARSESDTHAQTLATQRARDKQIRVDVIKGSF